MMSLGSRVLTGRSALRHLGWIAALAVGTAAVSGGCGNNVEMTASGTAADASTTTSGAGGATTAGPTSGPTTGPTSGPTSGSSSATSSGSGGGSSSTSSGGIQPLCATTALTPTRGSAIALTPDNSRLITVNRDVGSVTVMSIDYTDGQPKMTVVAELTVGAEPWQVAVDGCGHTAYVVLRKDQKVVRIDDLDGAPVVGATVEVGSEPTGIALTPNNTKIYVTNWVDGTLSVIDPSKMAVVSTVDLNPSIVATGKLGPVTPRAALAHPRAVAITNSGDAIDDDESVLVTEWFSLRTGPESAVGTEADTNWEGLVYKVKVSDGSIERISLPSVKDTGFKDIKDQVTGCFPNQLTSITIDKGFAYVTSTCASPAGPLGVFLGKNAGGACTQATADADCGFGGVCNATGKCDPNTRDVKTTTHPGLSIIDLGLGKATTTTLDTLYDSKGSARMPLLQNDLGFFKTFAYTAATGADAVFRIVITDGQITDVGSDNNQFINLRTDAADKGIRLPIGIATSYDTTKTFAFVNNDGAREVTALNFGPQAIAGKDANDLRITSSAALPAPGSPEDHVLRGKRFFATGLARWSLNGAAWGSCAACHFDGLSDNVTWYFARGPRQSTSLEGSFASKDPLDQRIFNWTGIFDEIADFEANTRDISGGLGAIVTKDPVTGQETRINTAAEVPQQQGLQGSSADIADPLGASAHPHSVINDWKDIESWVKTIRSPRRVKALIPADVTAGKALFAGSLGNCIGCHSGAKWTISKRFYEPSDTINAATADISPLSLSSKTWNVKLNGFPAALFPAADATNGFMRFGAPPGAEQLQCVLRPVGTIGTIVGGVPQGVSPPEVNVLELRQDMVTGSQGAAATGRGYNPPSLLGMQVGAPYFHGGNARTLEELFSNIFLKHHQSAIASVFSPEDIEVKQLVTYVLSLDEEETPFNIPAKGNTGGDLCFYP
jgi:YVTN family beta-propeller protein